MWAKCDSAASYNCQVLSMKMARNQRFEMVQEDQKGMGEKVCDALSGSSARVLTDEVL